MLRIILFTLLSICLPKLLAGQTAELLRLIQNEMQGLPNGTELSIGVLENGTWTKLGYRLEDQKLVTVQNADQIFEIGSITKTFTASLIMKLVGEGKMELSDPIQDYLPVQMARDSFLGQTIRVQDLITHTSGLSTAPGSYTLPYLRAILFTPKNPNRNFKARHYYRYLKKMELDYVPGKNWEYNNSAYGLLGAFIETLEGISWEEAVQQNIFQPLGMQDSYFAIGPLIKDRFVTGITEKGKPAKSWEMNFINPAGVIKTSLNDMIRYTSAQLSPPSEDLGFLQAAQNTLDLTITMPAGKLWEGNAMGLGWWYNREDAQHPFHWHAGSSGGYTAFAGFAADEGRAVVILSNISSSHPQARAENRIPKPILLGQKILRL